MPSKTMLATNPRHWPAKENLAAGWQESQPGLWFNHAASVSLELDGLWHSYADPTESRKSSPGFMTVRDAMRDAQTRAGQVRLSA